MEISLVVPRDRQVIESYGDGRFKVSGQHYEGSVLVFPGHSENWSVTAMEQVSAASLAAVVAAEETVEVLLIGCGPRMAMIPAELKTEMRGHGIALEPMDTGAACRTYNVLLSEGRAVAAALIAID